MGKVIGDAKYTASDVAKWFLCHNEIEVETGGADELTNMKIQKLLYYAQGAFLAVTGKPLFSDPICAWTHGPVVPNVYHEYKVHGRRGIPVPTDFDPDMFDEEERALLSEVYDEFGQYSAWKLRNMTHSETPWIKTAQGEEIPLDSIKGYFKEHYVA